MTTKSNPTIIDISSIDIDIARVLVDTTSTHQALNIEIIERCRSLLENDKGRLIKLLEITQDKITGSAMSLIEPPADTAYGTPVPEDENFHDPERQSNEKILLGKYEELEMNISLDIKRILKGN